MNTNSSFEFSHAVVLSGDAMNDAESFERTPVVPRTGLGAGYISIFMGGRRGYWEDGHKQWT